MHFSVYFDCILNEKNGSFHIEIMILASHMMGAMGARRGRQEGALAPPPGNSKIWGPPKDNLTRKNFFLII